MGVLTNYITEKIRDIRYVSVDDDGVPRKKLFFQPTDSEERIEVDFSAGVDLDILSSVIAGEKTRFALGSRDEFSFDDFDVIDGELHGRVSPSNHTWFVTGVGGPGGGGSPAEIINGRVTGQDNFYAVLGGPDPIKRVSGTFSFGEGAGSDRTFSPITLAADKTQGGLANMLHLNLGPDAWSLTKRISSGSFDIIAFGYHTLLTDGTIYSVSMEIDSVTGTVIVTPPMGGKVKVIDSDITTIAPLYGWIQYLGDSISGYKGFWHSFTTGPSIAEALRAEGAGASGADLALLYGDGLTRRRKINGVLNSGSGWYRIATEVVASTYLMSGKVIVSASDQGLSGGIGRRTFWEVDVATFVGAGAPRLGQRYAEDYFPAFSQMRLSRNDGTFDIGLDIFKAGEDPLSYSVEFFGMFLPVETPVLGAVVLPTSSTTINAVSSGTPNLIQQAANPDTSGATLVALEVEVNQLKAILRNAGLLAP